MAPAAREAREQQRALWATAAVGWVADRDPVGPSDLVTASLIELAGIREGQTVLDMACGSGNPAFAIAHAVGRGGRVVALDVVAEMVRGARELALELGVPNVEFRVVADETALDTGERFDAITCRFGLMFMPEPARAVAAWFSLLKPQGRIALSTWARFDAIDFVRGIVARHGAVPEVDANAPDVLALNSPQMLGEILTAARYHNVRVETVRVPVFAELPPDEWWDLMARVGGPLVTLIAAQPPDTRRAIREDGIRALRTRHPSGIVAEFGDALLASGSAP
jgi:SAM-dependent methyltransferase